MSVCPGAAAFTFWFSYVSFVVFALGACIGSFLNVCIYRIPRDESVIRPRSHCPHCQHMIAWYDNIPIVSYLWLRARCRHCGQPISARYFLVEALTGTLFALVWWEYGMDVRTPVYWIVISGLILGTFIDLDHLILPDRVTVGGTILGFALSPIFPEMHGVHTWQDAWISSALGWAVGFGLLWLIGAVGELILKKEAMGFGDVKLLGAVGALLGWRAVVFVLVASSVIGSAVGVTLVLFKKQEWRGQIPYGPYLALATVIWILWGYRWVGPFLSWLMSSGL